MLVACSGGLHRLEAVQTSTRPALTHKLNSGFQSPNLAPVRLAAQQGHSMPVSACLALVKLSFCFQPACLPASLPPCLPPCLPPFLDDANRFASSEPVGLEDPRVGWVPLKFQVAACLSRRRAREPLCPEGSRAAPIQSSKGGVPGLDRPRVA